MLIWGLTQQEIIQAAERADVRIAGGNGGAVDDHGTPAKQGRAFNFTLKTTRVPPAWTRRSQNIKNKDGQYRRVVGAVCWHGHREFMREVFKINPEARIKTGIADYRGSKHFEDTHGTTHSQGGNQYGRRGFGEACDCPREA
jgi:hypothetical protein